MGDRKSIAIRQLYSQMALERTDAWLDAFFGLHDAVGPRCTSCAFPFVGRGCNDHCHCHRVLVFSRVFLLAVDIAAIFISIIGRLLGKSNLPLSALTTLPTPLVSIYIFVADFLLVQTLLRAQAAVLRENEARPSPLVRAQVRKRKKGHSKEINPIVATFSTVVWEASLKK